MKSKNPNRLFLGSPCALPLIVGEFCIIVTIQKWLNNNLKGASFD